MGTKDCLRHDTRGAMPTAKENKEKKRSGQNIGPEGEGKYLLRERERGGGGGGGEGPPPAKGKARRNLPLATVVRHKRRMATWSTETTPDGRESSV